MNRSTVIREFLGKPLPLGKEQKKVILYARVSSRAMKDDLNNQVEALKQYAYASGQSFDDVWTDYGSGLNYRRVKFRKLINLALNGQLDKVIIAHKDRLVRFGYEFIEDVLNECGAQIVLINRSDKSDFMQELAEDLIAIVQHFCAKFYGKRSYRCKKAKNLVTLAAESLTEECQNNETNN